MRAGVLVIIGAVLPLVLGVTLGSITTAEGKGTWAYPMQPTAFLLLSLGLAVSHLLVLIGYLEVARRTTGAGSKFATVGGLGTAIVAACEVWSALVAKTDLDASVIGALNTSYAVSSIVILVGTLGAGIALHATKSRFALPLLVSGGFFLVAIPVRFLASDGFGIAALTIWSLLYIWLGIRLGVRRKVDRAAELV
jgi:hypothetical protein